MNFEERLNKILNEQPEAPTKAPPKKAPTKAPPKKKPNVVPNPHRAPFTHPDIEEEPKNKG